jgi:hypothetical protein
VWQHGKGPATVKLIFVYNADVGLVSGIIDAVHKIVSPGTYPCSLCAVTYGAVRMDPRWRAWLNAAPFAAHFYHRQDFQAAYPALAAIPLPCVLVDRNGKTDTLVTSDALAQVTTLDALIALIERRLDPLYPAAP